MKHKWINKPGITCPCPQCSTCKICKLCGLNRSKLDGINFQYSHYLFGHYTPYGFISCANMILKSVL